MADKSKKGKGKLPSVSGLAKTFQGDAKPAEAVTTKGKSQSTAVSENKYENLKSDSGNKYENLNTVSGNQYENFNLMFSEKATIKTESKKEEPHAIKTQATRTSVIKDEEKPDEDTIERRNRIVQLKPATERGKGKPSPVKQPLYTGLVKGQSSPYQNDGELYDTLDNAGAEYIQPISERDEVPAKTLRKGSVAGRPLPDVPSSPQRSISTEEPGFYDVPDETSGGSAADLQNVKYGSIKQLLKDKEGLPMYEKQHMQDLKKALFASGKGKNGSFVLILMQDFAEGDDPYRLIAYNSGVLVDKPILRSGNRFKLSGSGNKTFLDIKKLIEYYSKNKIPETTCNLLYPAKITL